MWTLDINFAILQSDPSRWICVSWYCLWYVRLHHTVFHVMMYCTVLWEYSIPHQKLTCRVMTVRNWQSDHPQFSKRVGDSSHSACQTTPHNASTMRQLDRNQLSPCPASSIQQLSYPTHCRFLFSFQLLHLFSSPLFPSLLCLSLVPFFLPILIFYL